MSPKADDTVGEKRFDSLENRVFTLEDEMTKSRLDRAQLHMDIKQNTDITKQIHDDIQVVIDLLRGSKVVAKVIAWTAGIGVAVATIWAALHHYKIVG